MKYEFNKYLEAINLPIAIRERIETIADYVALLCDEELGEIFVSDYFQEDGTRQYENILFFSASYVVEAKSFVTDVDLDIAPIADGIYYVNLSAQNYDFRNATEQSRVFIKCMLEQGAPSLGFELKGAKENCSHAMRILEAIIKPNLAK